VFAALTGGAYAAAKVGSAQVADNSLRSADIRDRGIKGVDVARRTLRAEHFRAGAVPAGPAGPKGDPGAPGARGPSFSDGRRAPNVQDIPCNTATVVGALPLTVGQPSRIWTQAQGALRGDGSTATDYALWLRLRNAADTATLATTMAAWDGGEPLTDAVIALAPGGVLFVGAELEPQQTTPFVAAPGSYILQLVALAGGTCGATLPSFGFNGGAQMGYVLTGTG
jgi:hypothetical protein